MDAAADSGVAHEAAEQEDSKDFKEAGASDYRRSERKRRDRKPVFSPDDFVSGKHGQASTSGQSAPPKKKRKIGRQVPSASAANRPYDVLPDGTPFSCDLCQSPYVCNPLLSKNGSRVKRSRHMPSPQQKLNPLTGKLLTLCNACGRSLDKPRPSKQKLQPSQEEKEAFLADCRAFASSLASQLQDSDAERLYCPSFQATSCECLQNYIKADGNEETMLERGRELLALHKEAKRLSSEKVYTQDKPLEKKRMKSGSIGLGNGMKRSRRFEAFILEKRVGLKRDLHLCERATQRILCYSNNFLHKKLKTEQRGSRVVRQKGKAALGLLEPFDKVATYHCCVDKCVRMVHSHKNLLQQWRKRATSSQSEARRVLAEMLTPSGGVRSNCYKFISWVTGCSNSTIGKVRDQMQRTKGDREPPPHGLYSYWQQKGHNQAKGSRPSATVTHDDDLGTEGTSSSAGTTAMPSGSVQSTESGFLVSTSVPVQQFPQQGIVSSGTSPQQQQLMALQHQLVQQQAAISQQQQQVQQQMLTHTNMQQLSWSHNASSLASIQQQLLMQMSQLQTAQQQLAQTIQALQQQLALAQTAHPQLALAQASQQQNPMAAPCFMQQQNVQTAFQQQNFGQNPFQQQQQNMAQNAAQQQENFVHNPQPQFVQNSQQAIVSPVQFAPPKNMQQQQQQQQMFNSQQFTGVSCVQPQFQPATSMEQQFFVTPSAQQFVPVSSQQPFMNGPVAQQIIPAPPGQQTFNIMPVQQQMTVVPQAACTGLQQQQTWNAPSAITSQQNSLSTGQFTTVSQQPQPVSTVSPLQPFQPLNQQTVQESSNPLSAGLQPGPLQIQQFPQQGSQQTMITTPTNQGTRGSVQSVAQYNSSFPQSWNNVGIGPVQSGENQLGINLQQISSHQTANAQRPDQLNIGSQQSAGQQKISSQQAVNQQDASFTQTVAVCQQSTVDTISQSSTIQQHSSNQLNTDQSQSGTGQGIVILQKDIVRNSDSSKPTGQQNMSGSDTCPKQSSGLQQNIIMTDAGVRQGCSQQSSSQTQSVAQIDPLMLTPPSTQLRGGQYEHKRVNANCQQTVGQQLLLTLVPNQQQSATLVQQQQTLVPDQQRDVGALGKQIIASSQQHEALAQQHHQHPTDDPVAVEHMHQPVQPASNQHQNLTQQPGVNVQLQNNAASRPVVSVGPFSQQQTSSLHGQEPSSNSGHSQSVNAQFSTAMNIAEQSFTQTFPASRNGQGEAETLSRSVSDSVGQSVQLNLGTQNNRLEPSVNIDHRSKTVTQTKQVQPLQMVVNLAVPRNSQPLVKSQQDLVMGIANQSQPVKSNAHPSKQGLLKGMANQAQALKHARQSGKHPGKTHQSGPLTVKKLLQQRAAASEAAQTQVNPFTVPSTQLSSTFSPTVPSTQLSSAVTPSVPFTRLSSAVSPSVPSTPLSSAVSPTVLSTQLSGGHSGTEYANLSRCSLSKMSVTQLRSDSATAGTPPQHIISSTQQVLTQSQPADTASQQFLIQPQAVTNTVAVSHAVSASNVSAGISGEIITGNAISLNPDDSSSGQTQSSLLVTTQTSSEETIVPVTKQPKTKGKKHTNGKPGQLSTSVTSLSPSKAKVAAGKVVDSVGQTLTLTSAPVTSVSPGPAPSKTVPVSVALISLGPGQAAGVKGAAVRPEAPKQIVITLPLFIAGPRQTLGGGSVQTLGTRLPLVQVPPEPSPSATQQQNSGKIPAPVVANSLPIMVLQPNIPLPQSASTRLQLVTTQAHSSSQTQLTTSSSQPVESLPASLTPLGPIASSAQQRGGQPRGTRVQAEPRTTACQLSSASAWSEPSQSQPGMGEPQSFSVLPVVSDGHAVITSYQERVAVSVSSGISDTQTVAATEGTLSSKSSPPVLLLSPSKSALNSQYGAKLVENSVTSASPKCSSAVPSASLVSSNVSVSKLQSTSSASDVTTTLRTAPTVILPWENSQGLQATVEKDLTVQKEITWDQNVTTAVTANTEPVPALDANIRFTPGKSAVPKTKGKGKKAAKAAQKKQKTTANATAQTLPPNRLVTSSVPGSDLSNAVLILDDSSDNGNTCSSVHPFSPTVTSTQLIGGHSGNEWTKPSTPAVTAPNQLCSQTFPVPSSSIHCQPETVSCLTSSDTVQIFNLTVPLPSAAQFSSQQMASGTGNSFVGTDGVTPGTPLQVVDIVLPNQQHSGGQVLMSSAPPEPLNTLRATLPSRCGAQSDLSKGRYGAKRVTAPPAGSASDIASLVVKDPQAQTHGLSTSTGSVSQSSETRQVTEQTGGQCLSSNSINSQSRTVPSESSTVCQSEKQPSKRDRTSKRSKPVPESQSSRKTASESKKKKTAKKADLCGYESRSGVERVLTGNAPFTMSCSSASSTGVADTTVSAPFPSTDGVATTASSVVLSSTTSLASTVSFIPLPSTTTFTTSVGPILLPASRHAVTTNPTTTTAMAGASHLDFPVSFTPAVDANKQMVCVSGPMSYKQMQALLAHLQVPPGAGVVQISSQADSRVSGAEVTPAGPASPRPPSAMLSGGHFPPSQLSRGRFGADRVSISFASQQTSSLSKSSNTSAAVLHSKPSVTKSSDNCPAMSQSTLMPTLTDCTRHSARITPVSVSFTTQSSVSQTFTTQSIVAMPFTTPSTVIPQSPAKMVSEQTVVSRAGSGGTVLSQKGRTDGEDRTAVGGTVVSQGKLEDVASSGADLPQKGRVEGAASAGGKRKVPLGRREDSRVDGVVVSQGRAEASRSGGAVVSQGGAEAVGAGGGHLPQGGGAIASPSGGAVHAQKGRAQGVLPPFERTPPPRPVLSAMLTGDMPIPVSTHARVQTPSGSSHAAPTHVPVQTASSSVYQAPPRLRTRESVAVSPSTSCKTVSAGGIPHQMSSAGNSGWEKRVGVTHTADRSGQPPVTSFNFRDQQEAVNTTSSFSSTTASTGLAGNLTYAHPKKKTSRLEIKSKPCQTVSLPLTPTLSSPTFSSSSSSSSLSSPESSSSLAGLLSSRRHDESSDNGRSILSSKTSTSGPTSSTNLVRSDFQSVRSRELHTVVETETSLVYCRPEPAHMRASSRWHWTTDILPSGDARERVASTDIQKTRHSKPSAFYSHTSASQPESSAHLAERVSGFRTVTHASAQRAMESSTIHQQLHSARHGHEEVQSTSKQMPASWRDPFALPTAASSQGQSVLSTTKQSSVEVMHSSKQPTHETVHLTSKHQETGHQTSTHVTASVQDVMQPALKHVTTASSHNNAMMATSKQVALETAHAVSTPSVDEAEHHLTKQHSFSSTQSQHSTVSQSEHASVSQSQHPSVSQSQHPSVSQAQHSTSSSLNPLISAPLQYPSFPPPLPQPVAHTPLPFVFFGHRPSPVFDSHPPTPYTAHADRLLAPSPHRGLDFDTDDNDLLSTTGFHPFISSSSSRSRNSSGASSIEPSITIDPAMLPFHDLLQMMPPANLTLAVAEVAAPANVREDGDSG